MVCTLEVLWSKFSHFKRSTVNCSWSGGKSETCAERVEWILGGITVCNAIYLWNIIRYNDIFVLQWLYTMLSSLKHYW
jgi:hypothetical protein